MLVAVIGLGSIGMVSLKNFLEEGLEVVGFEKGSQVGGLWVSNDDENVTCALKTTRANWSKHRMCTGDFPHLDSTSLHPTQQELADWHQLYAENFNLLPHIKFNTTVLSVDLLEETGDDATAGYEITFFNKDSEVPQVQLVEKVFLATGLNSLPFVPEIPGIKEFGGVVKHSQGFKSGSLFTGKRCIVVGSRSSASDVCEALVKEDASAVFLSHRGGVLVVPRFWAGRSIDFYFSRRGQNLMDMLDSIRPYTSRLLQNGILRLMSSTTFKFKKEWAFLPYPDVVSSVPTISDVIIPLLDSGKITSIPIISSVSSSNSVTLSDGTTLEDIDAIIFATGYEGATPSLLSSSTLTRMAPPSSIDAEVQEGYQSDGFLLLYKGSLPPSLPSLAMSLQGLGTDGALPIADVKSMWLAGVWSGRVLLASEEERWNDALKDKAWWIGLKKFGIKPTPGHIPYGPAISFLARGAGCEIDEHLSWSSPSAWKWWLSGNMRLSRLLLDGMASPAIYRLWGRNRKEGARETIERANEYQNYSKLRTDH